MMILAAGHLFTRTAFLASTYLLSSSPALLLPSEVSNNNHSNKGKVEERLDYSNLWVSRSKSYFPGDTSHNLLEEELYYDAMIPPLRAAIHSTLEKDPGLAGPLIRLAFHDATTWEQTKSKEGIVVTTGGPNGSVRYELDWNENRALSKPLAIVEEILEQTSPSITLADVIAVAGATAIEHAGGPRIALRLGRPDATCADPHSLRGPMEMETERSKITSTMPSPAMDSDGLRLYFGKRLHLREEEFVALSGVHGLGRHVTLLGMPKSCLKNLTRTCLEEAPQSLPFVSSSVDRFSNGYFQYLLRWYDRDIQLGDVAFIPTDVALAVDPGLRRYVKAFARDEPRFFRTFARAYQKLVEVTATSSKRY